MDLEVIESNNGGELVKNSADLSVIEGFQNMPYLALFGGNPGFPTPTDRPEGEQAFDWWGNTFLEEDQQFNSLTEYVLNNVSLTSSGRIEIEEAVKKDLAFMENFADVTIEVIITGVDRCRIEITLQELSNQQEKEFVFIWDATEKELVTESSDSVNLTEEAFFYDSFDDNSNGWFPSGSVPGDGFLKMTATNFTFLRDKFNGSAPLGDYEIYLTVSSVTGTITLSTTIVDDALGPATLLYTLVPDIPGDITATGVYRYTLTIDSNNLDDMSDLLFQRNIGAVSIEFSSILINYLG